eukprot:PhM_4_TR1291/c1_g1_i2/m.58321
MYRSLPFRAIAQRRFCVGLKTRTTSSWSVSPSSMCASSLPISAVAVTWYSTDINQTTETKLPEALEEHLNILAKGGLDKRTIKLLKDVAIKDKMTSTFNAIVENVHAAVKRKASKTDVAGPDMSLPSFRELVAGCGADAPEVQRVLATLDYEQREQLELDMEVQLIKMAPQLTTFPKDCRDWLYVALLWDGKQQDDGIKQDGKQQRDPDAATGGCQAKQGARDLSDTQQSSRILRYHAAAVALQILRDIHYCLPLRPGSVTHLTSSLIVSNSHAMLGQSSYVKQFSGKLRATYEDSINKLPFLTNYSTPRAGKSTVLSNGLRTASLEDQLSLIRAADGTLCAFVVVAATFNNNTRLLKSEIKDGTAEEACFAIDCRLVHAMLRPFFVTPSGGVDTRCAFVVVA